MPNMDDQDLVEQAQNDSQAFGALYDRYVNRVYAYAYRQTQDEALAQDITAVTFEKALRHIQRYEWRGKSFAVWLYRIARNEIIQQHRKERFLAPWRKNGQVTERRLVETAVILGCSTANIHLRLHRALKRLRQQLELLAAAREVNYV